MSENMMIKKLEMYAMLIAIENDLISCFKKKLTIEEIPDNIKEKAKASNNDISTYDGLLRSLDLQSYIEIININIEKLNVTLAERKFLNNDFARVIPIRNKVMHPRPLDFYDYPILKECFYKVESIIRFVEWDNVNLTIKMIADTPDKLLDLKYPEQKSNTIIENLPSYTDYEETSFIGRNRECAKIKEMLYKSNVHILTIVGDGGIGKTAIALKLLYDILDSDNPRFELIIWASLKTTELNKFEFKQIKDAITNTAQLYNKIDEFVGREEGITTKEWLITLAKEFNTLFVLDNLETINTRDIKTFLDEFSEQGKVLITSRIGLGEMEHRYQLEGMNDHDLLEYFDALLKLHGIEGVFTDAEKLKIAKDDFHSNPLSIKWFVKGLYNGKSIEQLIENKETLVSYCMSNVYEKLSEVARSILTIITISSTDLTYAELMYYCDKKLNDDIIIRKAINELIKCNFINHSKFQDGFILSVTDFAKEFLSLNPYTDTKILGEYKQRQRQLQLFKQDVLTKQHVNPYSMKAFSFINNDISRVIAAYYLCEAMQCANKDDLKTAFELIEFAKKLAPRYFECNKISAFLNTTINPTKAKEEYELSISYCENDIELATVHVLYAGFLLRIDDYDCALEQLNKAHEIDKDNYYIKMEKCKIYSTIGEYDKAEKILEEVRFSDLQSTRDENIYLTRNADILKRRAEIYEPRDYGRKFTLISQAIRILETSKIPDQGIYDYMAILLKEVCYMYFDRNKLEYLIEKLEDNIKALKRVPKFKKLKEAILSKLDLIEDVGLRKKLKQLVYNYNEILPQLKEREGVVYLAKNNFGFIKNQEYPLGIYFKLGDKIKNLDEGDIVELENVLQTERGPIAINVKVLYNIKDII